MKFLLILCLAVCCYTLSQKEEDEAWKKYKIAFYKKYDDPAEDQMRKEIFLKNKKKVEEHHDRYNKGLEPWAGLEISEASDWTGEEMINYLRTGTLPNGQVVQKNQP